MRPFTGSGPVKEKLKILKKHILKEDLVLIEFFSRQILLRFKPGQFVMLELPGVFLARPFSIFELTQEGFNLLIKIKGKGTRNLAKMAEGEKLWARGPLGKPVWLSGKILFIAGGVGIAPLLEIARANPKENELLWGMDEFPEMLVKRVEPWFDSVALKKTEEGLITEFIPEKNWDYVVACGPEPMAWQIKKKFKDTPVYFSFENIMACGMGFCAGCTIKINNKFVRLCKEGPFLKI